MPLQGAAAVRAWELGAAAVCVCCWYRVRISLGPRDARQVRKPRHLTSNDLSAIWSLCWRKMSVDANGLYKQKIYTNGGTGWTTTTQTKETRVRCEPTED